MMIKRTLEKQIEDSISNWPVTLITGARQVGKTTTCVELAKRMDFNYVSLDNLKERSLAINNPESFLELHPFPLIIDEVQYAPNLFDEIEHLVNERKLSSGNNKGMYVLTGSYAYNLMCNVTQSMAGRINIIEMPPLSVNEINGREEIPFTIDIKKIIERTTDVSEDEINRMIQKGMFPALYDDVVDIQGFYSNYVNTYLERDVSLLINLKDKVRFTEFLTILASHTGQELVYETIANAVGVSSVTIKNWVTILETGHIIHLLRPFYDTSVMKRMAKHPKLYFWDTGLVCYLLGIDKPEMIKSSPFNGRLLETYAINEIMKSHINNGKHTRMYYFRTLDGYEIDLTLCYDGVVNLIECKYGKEINTHDARSFSKFVSQTYPEKKCCVICNAKKLTYLTKEVAVIPLSSI